MRTAARRRVALNAEGATDCFDICDCPVPRGLRHIPSISLVARATDRRVVTYGFNPQADVKALNLEADPDGSRFSVFFAGKRGAPDHQIDGLHLPMPGEHNVTNALAAILIHAMNGLGRRK